MASDKMGKVFPYESELQKNQFPIATLDPKVKEQHSFGLSIANAIYWRGTYDNFIIDRPERIRKNRLYAQGRQNPDQYKPLLDAQIDNSGDRSWMNIDWSIESPLPNLVNRLVGRLINQDFKIIYKSIDPLAKVRKQKDRDKMFGDLIRQQTAALIKEQTGLEVEKFDGFVAESKDEIDLYMEMEYRQPVEIAMEEITQWEFYNNDWKQIEKRLAHDIVENNKMAIRWYYDENDNIRCRYVDIENLLHSYTSDPFYNDVEYVGEVVMLTLRDIRKRNQSLTEEQLFDIAKMASGKYGNPQWRFGDFYNRDYSGTYQYDDYRIQCLDFVYYTIDELTYEKKSKSDRLYFNKKDYGYKGAKFSKYDVEVTRKQIEMEYEGLWVVGTKYLVKYGRSKNITRVSQKGKMSPKCLRKYLIVEPQMIGGTSTSLVERVIPNVDHIQMATLKMRHFLAESVPPGLQIDTTALVNLSVNGSKWSPLEVIKLFKQKGIVLYNGQDSNGDPMNRRPIDFLQNGIGDGLVPFMNLISFQNQIILQNLGLNSPADALQPDKKSLVGIEKLALLETNNATRELFEAYNYGIFERSGKVVGRMIQDKIRFADGGINQYKDVIGEYPVEILKTLPNDMKLAEFGIMVEALPDAMEVQELIQNVNAAVANGEITFEDSLDIKQVLNTKKAARILAYRRKKRREEAMQERAMQEQMVAQREQQNILASAEAEKLKAIAKAEAEVMVMQAKAQIEKELETHKVNEQIKIVDRKGYWEMRKIEEAAEANLQNTESKSLVPQPKVFPDPIESAQRTD